MGKSAAELLAEGVANKVKLALGEQMEILTLETIYSLESAVLSAYWHGREKGLQEAYDRRREES